VEDYSANAKRGFFSKNKTIVAAVCVAFAFLLINYFIEKAKFVQNAVPTLRGEVQLENGFSITTTRNGYPILIKKDDPFIGSKLRFSGSVKSLFAETAISLVRSDEIVAEVGAHFGYNAINIGKKMNGKGKYYAFEPNGTALGCMKKSVALNDLEGIIVPRNVAISDSKRTVVIEDCLSAIKTPRGNYVNARTMSVEGDTIDGEMSDANESRPLSLLLIDVPGLEFPILKGAEKTIEKSKSITIVVSFDNAESSKSFDVKNELNKLKERGFKFYIAESYNNYKLAEISDVLAKKEAVIIMTRNGLL
jgi:FkbM family methyltransferase